MATYTIKGIISAERPCECCGNNNLEKNVVLESSDGVLMYVGTSCAGKLVYGKKSSRNTTLVTREADAREYAAKWVAVYGTTDAVLQKIASAIRTRFCPATVQNGAILIGADAR